MSVGHFHTTPTSMFDYEFCFLAAWFVTNFKCRAVGPSDSRVKQVYFQSYRVLMDALAVCPLTRKNLMLLDPVTYLHSGRRVGSHSMPSAPYAWRERNERETAPVCTCLLLHPFDGKEDPMLTHEIM